MMTLQTFSIIIFLGIIIYAFGKQYNKWYVAALGGLNLFLSGIIMLMSPMVNITDTANIVVGFVLFGLGAIFWVSETIAGIDIARNGGQDEE